MLDTLLYYVAAGAGAAFQLISACHALLNKRDPRSQLGWVVLCIMLPIVGAIAYWLFGVNRIRTRAQRWKARGRFRVASDARTHEHQIASLAIDHPGRAEEMTQLLQISQRVTQRPLIGGNQVEPLYNGDRAYPAMLEAIESARRTIHLSTYIFNVDKVGEQFVEALGRASERGVQVRILVDAIGEKYGRPRVGKAMRRYPKARVALFLPLTLSWKSIRVNLRCHRKLLVVDGAVGFTGGMNIAHRHVVLDGDNKHPTADIQFRVRGPVVNSLNETFLEDWFFATEEAVDWTPEKTAPA
ncbi:MAG TPA: phospholipase D-like domain-containing protein, partial [Kofleriaceae bacterium]|nr:phospholipase D-like domain-containing protein [Kofleriaceae bacterium]